MFLTRAIKVLSQEMDEAKTIQNFKDNFEYLKNFSIDQKDFIEKFTRTAQNPRISTGLNRLEYFETYISKIQTNSEKVLVSFDKLNFANQDLFNHMEHLNSVIASLKTLLTIPELQEVNLTAINSQLFVILWLLTTIEELVDLFFEFDYTWNVSEEIAKEFKKYDERGGIINSDMGYLISPIGMLEGFILDRKNRFNLMRTYIGNDLVQAGDPYSGLFYAIVAPSMTGKTQAAFTFKLLRCLYFLLNNDSTEITQDIYLNFKEISEFFRKLVANDFKKLKKLNRQNGKEGNIYDQISMSELRDSHSGTKFKTLGFIYYLIEHSNSNYNPNVQSWMSFYVINSEYYALFFDEFEASEENAFVRNLFRATNIPIFAANTNSNAANLVGKLIARSSRLASSKAWSLAVVKLNDINRNILSRMYPNLIGIIDQIVSGVENVHEKKLIRKFFDNFLRRQLIHLRPGFADIIAAKVLEISTNPNISLNIVLESIVDGLISKLSDKKPLMKTNHEGILGSLALFMDNAYLSSDISYKELIAKMSHLKSYLQYHYYYLINPVDVNKWCFLTYRPIPGSESLRYISQNKMFENWDLEYTYFKAEEIIPFFACQSAVSSVSIPSALRKGSIISKASPYSTIEAANTSQKIPLSGDELEVIAAICIIEASQHDVGSKKITFAGQDGESFLTNLFINLIEDNDLCLKAKVKLDCSIIKEHLNRAHVPFLFPAGMNLPEFFETNFSIARGFHNRSVNFGVYKRTKNISQIDVIFSYFIKNEPQTPPSIGICAVECKHRESNLYANNIAEILKKAVINSAKVSLIFCNSLGQSRKDTLKPLVKYCKSNNYTILKVEKAPFDDDFQLVLYSPDLPSPSVTTRLICIIFELNVINPVKEAEVKGSKFKNALVRFFKKFKL